MTDPDLNVVYVDPDQRARAMEVFQAIANEPPATMTRRLALRIRLGELIHPLGFHHWVRMRMYDPNSKRLIETGHWMCRVADCPVARAR